MALVDLVTAKLIWCIAGNSDVSQLSHFVFCAYQVLIGKYNFLILYRDFETIILFKNVLVFKLYIVF